MNQGNRSKISVEEIINRYANGESGSDIGKVAGVTASAIHGTLRRNGIKRRKDKGCNNRSKISVEEIINRYENGESGTEIGKIAGISAADKQITRFNNFCSING